MSVEGIPKVRWWSWALDAVFFVVGGAYLFQGELTWGLALIGVGVLAVAFDLWRRRVTLRGDDDDGEHSEGPDDIEEDEPVEAAERE